MSLQWFQEKKKEKKRVNRADLCVCRVTTLGQPLEVIKTTMAANRSDTFAGAMRRIWGRGGVLGCKFNIERDAREKKIKRNKN